MLSCRILEAFSCPRKGCEVPELEHHLAELRDENTCLKNQVSKTNARLSEERKAALEKLDLLAEARTELTDGFKALASVALESNDQSFIDLAQRLFLENFRKAPV